MRVLTFNATTPEGRAACRDYVQFMACPTSVHAWLRAERLQAEFARHREQLREAVNMQTVPDDAPFWDRIWKTKLDRRNFMRAACHRLSLDRQAMRKTATLMAQRQAEEADEAGGRTQMEKAA